MHDVTKDVLGDLIKYLRGLEIRDEEPDGKTMMEAKQMGKEVAPDAFAKHEGDVNLDSMMDLEEPDLDVEEDKDQGDALTAKQEEIKDFFNNRRPKRGAERKSKTFFMDAKGAGRPSAEVTKKSKK
jgi:hypothetical protein